MDGHGDADAPRWLRRVLRMRSVGASQSAPFERTGCYTGKIQFDLDMICLLKKLRWLKKMVVQPTQIRMFTYILYIPSIYIYIWKYCNHYTHLHLGCFFWVYGGENICFILQQQVPFVESYSDWWGFPPNRLNQLKGIMKRIDSSAYQVPVRTWACEPFFGWKWQQEKKDTLQ